MRPSGCYRASSVDNLEEKITLICGNPTAYC
jgi:hypothetical protein